MSSSAMYTNSQKLFSLQIPKSDWGYMLLFGIASSLLGFIQFQIPGVQDTSTDLREIPLLLALFYIRNPLSTIGLTFISTSGMFFFPESPYIQTFLMHVVSVFPASYMANIIKNKTYTALQFSLLWALLVTIYFLVFLIPASIFSYQLMGQNLDKTFTVYYSDLVNMIKYEWITCLVLTVLFSVQYHIREKLKYHLENLDLLVKKRTNDLSNANHELEAANMELQAQKEELMAINAHLQDTQSALLQSEKMAAMGTLTAGIAHEINNPLNYILGGITGLDEILKKLKIEDETALFLMQAIKTGTSRASKIVESLNKFTNSTAHIKEEVWLENLIETALIGIRSQMTGNIELKKQYGGNAVSIIADESNLVQVIINILSNAIQSISDKGCITIKTIYEIDSVCISIADTGIGISTENLPRITEPFFTTKDPGQGIGLGLAVAYNIIKEHQGALLIQSELGKGTLVKIYLPIVKI